MSDPQLGLTFTDFLAKMKDPAAADLVRQIKSFIRTFEERPAGHVVDPEADSSQVQAFLALSEQQFRQHPVWRSCQPEVLDQAVEGLEKYVMSKVWRQTFGVWQEDRERDERYRRLMQALGFVDLPTLMGVDVEPDANLLALAQAELLKMDRYKAPRDKLLCLVNVKTMVENIVQLAARGGANIGGADAFFPVFLLVVIRSRLPHLASNVEYIQRFRSRSRLSGQFDYMLCNLESAAMYLDTVNYEHLSVSQEQFLAHLAAAGIPEAHLELRRMQQEAVAAAGQAQGAAAEAKVAAAEVQAAAAAEAAEQPAGGHGSGEDGRLEKDALAAAAEGAGAEAPMEAAATAGADVADVLAGLQLADDGDGGPVAAAAAAESAGSDAGAGGLPSTALTSLAGTPQEPALLGGGAAELAGGREGSLTPLSDLDMRQPTLAGGGDDEGAGAGRIEPRELLFGETAGEQGAQLAVPPQQQHAQQAAWPRELSTPATVPDVALPEVQPYEESPLVEDLVADGTRHVLAAEAAGQLQQRYPYMYAQAEDLALADVEAVLLGYKELLLRYEALSRALQQQLGLFGGTYSAPTAAVGGSASTAAHRPKLEQQQAGFGSVIPPDLEAAYSQGAGIPLPAGMTGYGPSGAIEAAPSSSQDASPTGKWSPGGFLQRITSKGIRRSLTPPRERDGGTAAAAGAAAAAGEGGAKGGLQQPQQQQQQQQQQQGEASRHSPLRARLSPSKAAGQHAFFATLFGSSGGGGSAGAGNVRRAATAPTQQQTAQQQREQQEEQAHDNIQEQAGTAPQQQLLSGEPSLRMGAANASALLADTHASSDEAADEPSFAAGVPEPQLPAAGPHEEGQQLAVTGSQPEEQQAGAASLGPAPRDAAANESSRLLLSLPSPAPAAGKDALPEGPADLISLDGGAGNEPESVGDLLQLTPLESEAGEAPDTDDALEPAEGEPIAARHGSEQQTQTQTQAPAFASESAPAGSAGTQATDLLL